MNEAMRLSSVMPGFRQRLCLRILCILLLTLLTGCGRPLYHENPEGPPVCEQEADGRLRVVTTLFPYYDFVRQIAGEDVDLELVVPAGMDSHSFEPTPADMRKMQAADLMICNGGEMETWVRQALEAIDTSGMTVLEMMDYVDTVEEIIVEGMENTEEGHPYDMEDSEMDIVHDSQEEEIEYDEHIWTSPVNAMILTEIICGTLAELDPERAEDYTRRAEDYLKELSSIDAGFREVSAHRRRSMIVVGDRFPFRYLADTYGFDYRAAFPGCGGDTEPSAKTIAYLIDRIREDEIPAVYYLELSSRRVSEIISEETGAVPLLLHSCHNVTRPEFEQGVTYAALMRRNIENLRKGLDE